MSTEQDRLETIGKAMFGDQWQSATARLLRVDSRRIRHWMASTKPIPSGIWDDLGKIIDERIKELNTAKKAIKEQGNAN